MYYQTKPALLVVRHLAKGSETGREIYELVCRSSFYRGNRVIELLDGRKLTQNSSSRIKEYRVGSDAHSVECGNEESRLILAISIAFGNDIIRRARLISTQFKRYGHVTNVLRDPPVNCADGIFARGRALHYVRQLGGNGRRYGVPIPGVSRIPACNLRPRDRRACHDSHPHAVRVRRKPFALDARNVARRPSVDLSVADRLHLPREVQIVLANSYIQVRGDIDNVPGSDDRHLRIHQPGIEEIPRQKWL